MKQWLSNITRSTVLPSTRGCTVFARRYIGAMASPTIEDYSKWSNEELVKRVTDLETQLREQNIKYSRLVSSNASPVPPVKRAKKVAKRFDASKYSTRHIALKFAYLGARYNGFEHHANNKTPLPTVEEELWKALRKTKLILPTFRDGQSEDEVCWDGCDYSKCGRTDRGVSAFGQVIALRVRSSRPRETSGREDNGQEDGIANEAEVSQVRTDWHCIRDELPYVQLLNRVLPPDIRILAWCPSVSEDFSARFNCKERRYRYFFTNPAYLPDPSSDDAARGYLDIGKMQEAAKKLQGLHDFRNFCKVDPSKQITNFQRRIFSASICPLQSNEAAGALPNHFPFSTMADLNGSSHGTTAAEPGVQLYYFEVRGSAFLWHQVRHMVAILFLVGQSFENPSIVDHLLDIERYPGKPLYDMASDTPLVLWDCIFPRDMAMNGEDHGIDAQDLHAGYEDGLDWLYIGDQGLVRNESNSKRSSTGMENRKYGRLSIMDDLWSLWRHRKIDEVLSGCLMSTVAEQGSPLTPENSARSHLASSRYSARVFDGSDLPRTVGTYVPVLQRDCAETPEVLNERYAVRKSLNGHAVDCMVDRYAVEKSTR